MSVIAANDGTRRRLIGFAQLLGSGVISAAGLTAIASNRFQLLDGSTIVFLLLFIQWQTFSLTVAKGGLEQLVFATVSRDLTLSFDLGYAIRKQIAPMSGLTALVALLAFPPWAAAAIGMCVALDSYSLMVGAEMNARTHFKGPAVANLLNYPAFFALTATLAWTGRASSGLIVVAFVVTSVIRAAWLWLCRRPSSSGRTVVPRVQATIAVQQVGNYGLFRLDQLLLGIVAVRQSLDVSTASLAGYLYLAKFPELASGVLNIAGTVLFPVILSDPRRLRQVLLRPITLIAIGAVMAGLAFAGTAYVWLWRGPSSLTVWDAAPFLVHAAFIFPANALTYALLSRGYLQGILRFIVVGLSIGGLVTLVSAATHSLHAFAWLVPAQILAYMGAVGVLRWGPRAVLFTDRPSEPAQE